MKKFLIDQALLFVTGIAIAIMIPSVCNPLFTLLFEILVILSWCYLCRRLLALPFDLIFGKASHTAYFAYQCGIEDLEFVKDTHYYVWKFYYGNDKTISLFVPHAITNNGSNKIDLPRKNVKLDISYFKFSKILVHWSLSNSETESDSLS